MKGLGDLMQQAQQMQENMKKMQEEMADLEVVGESGAGLVKVTLTGKYDARNVSIDPSLLTEEKDVLEDLIAAAINDATRRVEQANKDKMGGLASGFNMPPGFQMPF